jgi:hypothetical protein
MAQLDSHGYITIEIGTQRLPVRMIAGRLNADLRTSRSVASWRGPRASRLAVAMVAAILVPLIGVTRYRHASPSKLSAG